jgi:hypothetical protein
MSPAESGSEENEQSNEDESYDVKPKKRAAKRGKAQKPVADLDSQDEQRDLYASDESGGKLPVQGK